MESITVTITADRRSTDKSLTAKTIENALKHSNLFNAVEVEEPSTENKVGEDKGITGGDEKVA